MDRHLITNLRTALNAVLAMDGPKSAALANISWGGDFKFS